MLRGHRFQLHRVEVVEIEPATTTHAFTRSYCSEIHVLLSQIMPSAHTHTPVYGPLFRTTRVSRYQKVKPVWISLKQETVNGSGISWAMCKSAPRSREITTPAPHHSSFFTGWMPFLPPNQQCQSTEGAECRLHIKHKIKYKVLATFISFYFSHSNI